MSEDEMLDKVHNYLGYKLDQFCEQDEAKTQDLEWSLATWRDEYFWRLRAEVKRYVEELYRGDQASDL